MPVVPKPSQLHQVYRLDVDPQTRRIASLDNNLNLRLLSWDTGEQLELPRLSIPDHYHEATQPRSAWIPVASILDLRLHKDGVSVLTTEGFWGCELREGATWTRISGHPTDPPAGMTLSNSAAFDFDGPISLAADYDSLQHGSSPIVLSADGSTIVGAPRLHEILGSPKAYKLQLKAISRVDGQTSTLAPKLKSAISALATNADGSIVAFSEGRDLRIIRRGQARAAQYAHHKMFVYALALSQDGRFVAANGLYPDDLRVAPRRTILWDVEARKVIGLMPNSALVGFVGRGERTRLILTRLEPSQPIPHRRQSMLFIPGQRAAVAAIPGQSVDWARGDSEFLVVGRQTAPAQVLLCHELEAVSGIEAQRFSFEGPS